MEKLLNIGTQDVITYAYGQHMHDYWEITYYTEGAGMNITDEVAYPFKAGTIICQPPKIVHEDISEKGYKNIFFEVDSFFDIRKPLVLIDDDSKRFLKVTELMYQEYFEDNDPTVISSFISVLNSYLIRWLNQSNKNAYVEEMKKEIFLNYSSTTFTISDCFQKLPWSESQLRRYFKSETGMTPQNYLESIRIRQAKNFLLFDSYTIAQVGFMCGYSDPYYFSRAFKKNTGMSPSEYRIRRKQQPASPS